MNNVCKWIGRAVVAGGLLAGGTAVADDGITFKIGASARSFDDFDFGPAALVGSPGSGVAALGIEGYSTGTHPGIAPSVGPAPIFTFNTVSYAGSSVEPDDSLALAPHLGLEFGLDVDSPEECSLSLGVGFQYFSFDGGSAGSSSGLTSFAQPFSFVDDAVAPATDTIIVTLPGGAAAPSPVTVSQDFDLDLAVLDLGLKGSYETGFLKFGLEAGPTLNFIDVETSQSFNTAGAPAVPGASTVYNSGPGLTSPSPTPASDDDSTVSLGLYFALTATVPVTDNVGIGIGYRYDWVDEDAETVHGSLDLSSHSFTLSVEIGF